MDRTVIFFVVVIICVLCTVWSACVMAARADEQLREITHDKKEPEEKEEDMTKQKNMQTVWDADGSNVLQDKYKC